MRDDQCMQKFIELTAQMNGVTPEQVRANMQEAIDAAYSQRHEAGHEGYLMMFGEEKPSPETFLLTIAKAVGGMDQ